MINNDNNNNYLYINTLTSLLFQSHHPDGYMYGELPYTANILTAVQRMTGYEKTACVRGFSCLSQSRDIYTIKTKMTNMEQNDYLVM